MTARRPDQSPGVLARQAQRSGFNGSLKGRLRSARPVDRANANSIFSTAGNTIPLGPQIFRVSDGFKDVDEGAYLIDLAGMIWWKTGPNQWTHLFSGEQEYPPTGYVPGHLYHPTKVTRDTADLLLGYNLAYTSEVDGPQFSVLVGHSLRNDGSYNTLLGNENKLDCYDVLHKFSNSHLLGSDNYAHVYYPLADSTVVEVGFANTVTLSTDTRVTLLGQSNSINGNTVDRSLIVGHSNSINAIDASVLSNVNMLGSFNYAEGSKSLILGHHNTVNGDSSLAVGENIEISGDFSWAIGSGVFNSSTPLATSEFGSLAARVVEIRRGVANTAALAPIGDYTTALRLHSANDTAVDLTVSNTGQLNVGGDPIVTGYFHTQGSASTTWVITHNLGYFPLVQAFDGTGLVVAPSSIQHDSVNQTTLTFGSSTAGGARLI